MIRELGKKSSLALALVFSLSGCATLDRLINGEKETEPAATAITQTPRYSENAQMSVPTDRQYKRWTRSRMEEESEVGASAGSMWVMEGQGAYLFAQNKTRREGDVLNVKLDGAALKQVETKVGVIKKLLKQLEEQEQQELAKSRGLASEPGKDAAAPAAAKAPEKKPEVEKDDKQALDEIQTVPSKIVEKLADGNYRVRGAQPFMIGKREYKVIVTGLIRPEDYNDEGVSSQRLLDPQYDVVSVRRGKQ